MFAKKPIGLAFVVGLLALAFAALPALAQANVSLRKGSATGAKLKNKAPITGFSSNLRFATNGGITLECAENEINGEVLSNGGATAILGVTSTRFQGTGGNPKCLTNVEGLTAEITSVTISNITLFSNETNSASAEFTANIGGELCTYAGTVASTFEFGVPLVLTIPGSTLTLQAGSGAKCPTSGVLSGSFAVTTGTEVVVATNP